ncbi:hypothetical protein HMPREF9318_01929 [Streptococcus urinalis FB127-CNA-2]|uniref:Uncharacterized protein n=1 Tax=Streptococcus urinalis 2285-97 TaxID=764291 RepID=G5KDA7_9STRE|nr:hypothetical protein [Streptococcus urinalis]EHJ55864.1 hypothetical protein STRUR_1855 [Streptococcus urinalis 2285-97]EKS17480.1 hypothetical protein HMPREF9318_01929 [Streptococcus urinalis FB127-CNA-2]VEF32698.1 Uncharacterised protein [Streptococcus urinalis]
MNRTLILRKKQILSQLCVSLIVCFSVFAVLGILVIIGFFLGRHFETSHFQLNWNDITKFIFVFLGFMVAVFTFISPFSDGSSDFDSALHLGISRFHYFSFNIFYYLILSFIKLLFDGFGHVKTNSPQLLDYFQSAFMNLTFNGFIGNFLALLIFALLGYAIYHWGWKFLAIANDLAQMAKWQEVIVSLVTLSLFILAYFTTIQKTEIK